MDHSEDNPEEDAFGKLLDLVTLWEQRRWGMLALSIVLCFFILMLFLCLSPFALVGAIWGWGKKIFLKFRRWGADILRPKDVVRARHTEPQSDLVRAFVEYELLLVSGKETPAARMAFIRALARVEQELEEHQILCAEIRKLRVEDERPRRRDAILSTKLRAERRRERERSTE